MVLYTPFRVGVSQHFQDKETSLPRSFQRQRIEGLFYTELNEISKMLHSHRPKEPYFIFPDIPAYKEISFEKRIRGKGIPASLRPS